MLGQQELERNFCMEQGAPQEGGTREEPGRILGQALTFWGRASQMVWGGRRRNVHHSWPVARENQEGGGYYGNWSILRGEERYWIRVPQAGWGPVWDLRVGFLTLGP